MSTKRVAARRKPLKCSLEQEDQQPLNLTLFQLPPGVEETFENKDYRPQEEEAKAVIDECEAVDEPEEPYWVQYEYRKAVEAELKIIDESIEGLHCELAFSGNPHYCKHFLHRINDLREGRQELIDDYMAHYPGRNPFESGRLASPPQPRVSPTKLPENP
jgi:hypothetical protein